MTEPNLIAPMSNGMLADFLMEIPHDLITLMHTLKPTTPEDLNPGLVLAGGYLRDLYCRRWELSTDPPRDIDIYHNEKVFIPQSLIDAKAQLTTFRPFTSARDLIEGFDFRCVQAAIGVDSAGVFYGWTSVHFMKDCTTRSLVLAKPYQWHGHAGTFARMTRLLSRGWNINDAQLAEVLDEVYTVMEEQGFFGSEFLAGDNNWNS